MNIIRFYFLTFLGSMLPQYMAFSVSQLVSSKKICVSVRWVTLWVRPPPCEYMCVRSLGYIVGASPPSVKICVSVRWVTLWVRPPPLCVHSLDPCMLPTPLCGIFFDI